MSNSKENSSLGPSLNESPGAVPISDTVNGLRAGCFKVKDNTFYFQHDNTSSSDEKIIDLRSELGFEGYGIFWAILELLHQNGGKMQMNSKRLAFALQVDEQKLSKVINDFDLFEFDNGNFYSQRLLNQIEYRAAIIDKRRDAGSKGGKSKAKAKQLLSNELQKERKGKERIEKDNKENKEILFKESVFSFSDYPADLLNAFFNDWSEHDTAGRMKWEKEKTWELKKRLEYWQRTSNKFNKKPEIKWS